MARRGEMGPQLGLPSYDFILRLLTSLCRLPPKTRLIEVPVFLGPATFAGRLTRCAVDRPAMSLCGASK